MPIKSLYKTKSSLYRKAFEKKGLKETGKFQYGGMNPTRSDSLFVLNNNRVINNLLSQGDYQWDSRFYRRVNPNRWTRSEYPAASRFWNESIPEEHKEGRQKDSNRPISDYRRRRGNFIGTSDWMPGGGDDYGVPFQYIHPNIAPQFKGDLRPIDRNGRRDDSKPYVYSYGYDNLAITPWDMLNAQQRIQRINKYGVSGSPYKTKEEFVEKTSDPEILKKQRLLKEAGLYKGDIDGLWGKNSKKAWDKYEQSVADKKPTTTGTTGTTTTTATTTAPTAPPVVSKPVIYTAPTKVQPKTTQTNSDTPWRFMLGNDSYQTFDEETAKTFAKDLGITNLQRGDNKNIDSATGKYRDYSSLISSPTTNTGTTGQITKYPKLKRMAFGGTVKSAPRLAKIYKASKLRK
jgi:hypothetical protein